MSVEHAMLKFKFNLNKRMNFYERLKSYVEEGYPVYETLERFRMRYEKRRDFRAKLVEIWLEKLKYGANISEALKGWIPEAELNLIESGEKGEGLNIGLGEAIKFSLAAAKMKSVIVGGAMYPLFLTVLTLFFLGAFSTSLAPTFKSIMPVEVWPSDAQNLYNISVFVAKYWMVFLAGFIGLGVLISKTIGFYFPFRDILDKIPPWSVYKSYQSSAFLISLASMMKSGISLNDSIKSLKRSSSPWLQRFLNLMLGNLKRGGKNYGIHLNVGLLDEETAGDVIDYSELGRFETAVQVIGEKNLQRSVADIESQMALAKNIMLMAMAATVGWIYFTNYNLNTEIADYSARKK